MRARKIAQPNTNNRIDDLKDLYFKKKVYRNKCRGKQRDRVCKLVPNEDVIDSESPRGFMNTVTEPILFPFRLLELSDLDEAVQEEKFQEYLISAAAGVQNINQVSTPSQTYHK